MVVKKSAKIHKKSGVRKKHPKKSSDTWMAAGFDISLASIAGAAWAYDATLKELKGPVFVMKSWPKNTHYFEKLLYLSRAENFIHDLQAQMKLVADLGEVYIAVEEPFPAGMVKRLESSAIKQQAELSGAFLSGVLRYGWQNLFQIPWQWWAANVAADLGISTHHTKWNYSTNPFPLAPSGRGSGKWRAKEWARTLDLAPDWPDLISSNKHGKISRPETSRARAVQPDDRYDALGIAEWLRKEIKKNSA